MAFSITSKIGGLFGWQVPSVIGLGCDVCLFAAGLFLGPDLADYLGPFDWPETFQASLQDGDFTVLKTRTQEGGYAEVWFCQRGDQGQVAMLLAHSGIFTEREENLALREGEAKPLLRDRPVVVLTNLELDGETVSFFELLDPVVGTRILRQPQTSGQQDCAWSAVEKVI